MPEVPGCKWLGNLKKKPGSFGDWAAFGIWSLEMGYRSIEVEGKKYEYVVGRKAVKIRGAGGYLKILPREEVVQPLGNMHVVTPFAIRQAILGLPTRRSFTCRKHGTVSRSLHSCRSA